MPQPLSSDILAPWLQVPRDWAEYCYDACQRSILVLDVLRQRGNTYSERKRETTPHVLTFDWTLVTDGRTLPRPVNYFLVEIAPAPGVPSNEEKRPFIVVDPRAGHGPGIGGMKHDSEIGKALEEGHPCYFIGFSPNPVEGQTVEDVCAAEAHFIATVAARHRQARGKPAVIGNCQAGWQIMMTAAVRPELFGPIMLAGSPLSYWAGVRGMNPMRYSGGLLGGTWMTALAGDMGNGIFDGAHLVANFESLNPANTYWTKPYNLYSNVDTEASRFLDFEKWWGNPVLLAAQEMQSIADNLFVGNRLSRGDIQATDGTRVDLRNIQSPIIVFCSWGDDITPPPQALQWIIDLHETDADVVQADQTIVYCLHQTIGHLGIFVSGKVATKEHDELTDAMEFIELLGPGIYEAVISNLDDDLTHRDLIEGNYLFTIERRSVADIRAICQQNPEDDRRFEAAARLSDINLAMYREFVRPAIRAVTNERTAELSRDLHPNRLRFGMFSDENPMMKSVSGLAEQVRKDRREASADNVFIVGEHKAADMVEGALQSFGQAMDRWKEATFLTTYGNPVVQTLAGLRAEGSGPSRPERDLSRAALATLKDQELRRRIGEGGALAAALRALCWVASAVDQADERLFHAVLRGARTSALLKETAPDTLREVLRDQQRLIRIAPEEAIAALPAMIGADPGVGERICAGIERLFALEPGILGPLGEERLARLRALLVPQSGSTSSSNDQSGKEATDG